MSLIGTLCFCTDCGSLIDRPTTSQQTQILCDVCRTPNENNWPVVQTSHSRPDLFQSTLQRKLRTHTQEVPEGLERGTKIKQTCPECSNDEMIFTEAQLRGADEGTTIFYHCTKCQYRYNTNN